MLADLPAQAPEFRPTNFWVQASAPIIGELLSSGFDQFRRLRRTRDFFVPTYGAPGGGYSEEDAAHLRGVIAQLAPAGSKKHAALMQALQGQIWALADYRVLLAAAAAVTAEHMNLLRFSESDVGAPLEQFHFDGRAYSRSALNYLLGLSFLKQQIGSAVSGIRNVLEIGGGFGTLGEILMQTGDYAYINVDIPPTAAVSSYYLARQAGAGLVDYLQTRGLKQIPLPAASQQMVLCPWQLPALRGQIDLFVNFISFQEMEPDVVANYLRQVDRLGTRFVLLRNLREGKQLKSAQQQYGVERAILGSDYDSLLPAYDLLASNVHPFGYKTVDGFHSELRLYRRRS